MDTGQVITELKTHANFFEVYHKTTFHCVRTNEKGNQVNVEVDILDAGPDVKPLLRYMCVARSEDGEMAMGNQAATVEEALLIVHWDKLG